MITTQAEIPSHTFPPKVNIPHQVGVATLAKQPGAASANETVYTAFMDRLLGLVVKASASKAEDPGFESRLRRNFFGVESYQ